MRVVEHMRRVETQWHVIRLWLDAAAVDAAEADQLAAVAKDFAAVDVPFNAQEVAELLARTVRHANAVEVLDRHTGDGTLVYPDWP